jgi:hypothetical protein
MMQLIATLIELALVECFEKDIIDWYPTDPDAPETFIAECEIDENAYIRAGEPPYGGDYCVSMCGLVCLIDATYLDGVWHSEQCAEVRV